jgi:hypothetical protein
MHRHVAHAPSPIRTSVRLGSLLILAIFVALGLVACSSTPIGAVIVEPELQEPAPDPMPAPADPVPGQPPSLGDAAGLRGDPGFDAAQLVGTQAVHYELLIDAIDGGESDLDPMRLAARDDIYVYARTLQSYVQSVMATFRVTGDLALLDHVDEIAEVMRSKLRDSWRGTLDGTNGTKDGYLNWVYRYGNERAFAGKDTSRGNEMKAHAMVAMIAHALDLNRDLESPTGRDYGAHADFWRDYLVNHFEAKWRERNGVPTGFPIMMRPHTHTYFSWMRYHYYMGHLTGEAGYLTEANRMADVLWSELRPVETKSGTAYVWARSVLAEGGGEDYLHPTTYARYVFGDVIEMHLEGFHNWASAEEIARYARTFTDLIMDSSDPIKNGFASDVGGGRPRAGLRSDSSWPRLSADRFRLSAYALIGAWDETGNLSAVAREVEEALRDSDTAILAAGLFLDAWLRIETAEESEGP